MTTEEQAREAHREIRRRSPRSARRFLATLPPEIRAALAQMAARLMDEARRREADDLRERAERQRAINRV